MKNLWKKWIFIAQFRFQDPDPDSEYGSGSNVAIWIQIHPDPVPDPDPKQCLQCHGMDPDMKLGVYYTMWIPDSDQILFKNSNLLAGKV